MPENQLNQLPFVKMHSKGHSIYSWPRKIFKMNKHEYFVIVPSLLQEKTAINCLF